MRSGPAALALLLALLLVLLLTGCTLPQAEPRARAGDFVVLDLQAWDASGREVLNLSGAHGALGNVGPNLPAGWTLNQTLALPPGVAAAMVGASPGASIDTGLVTADQAFGAWSENRTIRAPRLDAVPLEQHVPPEAVIEGPPLRVVWANATWSVDRLMRNESDARVWLNATMPPGTLLELPAYWNEHYHLWRSRLLGAANGQLQVEHEAETNRTAEVGGIPYVVRADAARVWADGNAPLAGQSLRFRAVLRDIVFVPAPGVLPDAPLVGLDSRRFTLGDLRGKPALLDFYATWCVTCKQQAPILARAHAEFPDVVIVSITIDPTDSASRVAAFAEAASAAPTAALGRPLPVNWTFAFDPTGQVAQGLGVVGIPREVVLDADGRVVSTSIGLRPWPDLQQDLAKASAPKSNRH